MTPLKPVTLTTPDGVSRELRDTPGARKRIFERYQESNFLKIAQERGDWALFEVAYLMMYDRKGRPPADLTLDEFMENTPTSARTEILATVMSAVTNGEKPKNELEALLAEQEKLIGSTSGASPSSASDSQIANSGGAIPGPNLTPESNASTSETNSSTTEPAS